MAHIDKKTSLQKLHSGEKNLAYADLSAIDLSNKDLSEANLEGANLRGAILKNTKLNNANLRDADFSGAQLDCAELKKTNLTRTNFSGATLQKVSLNEIILDKTNFRETIFIDMIFSGLEFVHIDFTEAQFKNVNFAACELLFVCMDRIQAGNITFERSFLSNTTFIKSTLYGLEMKEMECFGYALDFEEAHIISSEFKGQSCWANPGTALRVGVNLVRQYDEMMSFTKFFDRSWGATSFFVQTNFKQTRLTNVKFNFTIFAKTSGWDDIILKKVEFYKVHFLDFDAIKETPWKYIFSSHKYHWDIVKKMKTKGAVVNGQCNTEYENDWQRNYVLDDGLLPDFLKGCISNLGTKFINSTNKCSIQ